ncbi:MAG: hypothetical protein ABI536_06125 [Gallionella sp.]
MADFTQPIQPNIAILLGHSAVELRLAMPNEIFASYLALPDRVALNHNTARFPGLQK